MMGVIILIVIVVVVGGIVAYILTNKGSSVISATSKVEVHLELQPIESYMQTGSLTITTGKPIAIKSIIFDFYNSSRLIAQRMVIDTGITGFKEVYFNFTANATGAPVARIEGGQMLDNIVEKSTKFTFNIVYNTLDVVALRVTIYYYTSDGKLHHVTSEVVPIS